MENKYYHGLTGGLPFWFEEKILDESLRVLELMFKYKGIYCRSILKQLNIPIFEDPIFEDRDPISNGDDYISICMSNPPDKMEALDNEYFSSFQTYARQKIAIEFKPSIERGCIFRELPYEHLPGERQIYQSIDISHFNRILVGLVDLKDEALMKLSKICEPYGIPVMTFEEAEYMDSQKIKTK